MSNGLPMVPPPSPSPVTQREPKPKEEKVMAEEKPKRRQKSTSKTSHLPEDTLTREICSLRLSVDALTMEVAKLVCAIREKK